MEKLFTEEELELGKATQKFGFKCTECGKNFTREKRWILQALKGEQRRKMKFCSVKCKNTSQDQKLEVSCGTCGVSFKKKQSEIKKSKSGKHFCSQSCSAKFNNSNRKRN